MIIAAIYPVFVWFMVFRFRRTWQGVAAVACGTLAVIPIARLVQVVGGSVTGAAMAKIVYAEMALVGSVSVWLLTMKRPGANPACPYCRYDLTGLPTNQPGAVCPECGNTLTPIPRGPNDPYCLACGHDLRGIDPGATGHTCPSCGAPEDEFGNWTRARAARERADASRRSGPQGRSAR